TFSLTRLAGICRLEFCYEGVPFAASGALPLPFRRGSTATLTHKNLFRLRHRLPSHGYVNLGLLVLSPDPLYCRACWLGLCLLHAEIWTDCSDCGFWDPCSRPVAPIACQRSCLDLALEARCWAIGRR